MENLLQAYFGANGISFSAARVPIASCDFSLRKYSYQDAPNDWNQEQFRLADDEDLNWRIPQIRRAMELTNNDLKLVASPWSAPGWMKTNGNMQGAGTIQSDPAYSQAYAKYFAKFFEQYKQNGITFWAVTPQNEPLISQDPNFWYQAMYWNPQTQAEFVGKYLGPTLRASDAGKDLHILTLDHNRDDLPWWPDQFYAAHPNASLYSSGIAVHWYAKDAPWEILDETVARHPDKFIMMTEAATGWDFWPGNWELLDHYVHDIIQQMNHGVSGWIDWNLVVNMAGGPSWIGTFCGAPIIANADADEFYKQPNYYGMGHFSKLVRPGSQRIDLSITDQPNVEGVAFLRPDGTRILVLYNRDLNATYRYRIMEPGIGDNLELHYDIERSSVATIVYKPTN